MSSHAIKTKTTKRLEAAKLVQQAILYADSHDNMPAVSLQTLFHFACEHNCVELVKKLLVDPCVDPTRYGLRIACAQKSAEVVQVLLEDGRADQSWTTR